jgi:hypothetical protein
MRVTIARAIVTLLVAASTPTPEQVGGGTTTGFEGAGLVLLGAALGFLGSVFGSVLVGRLQLRREIRIELFESMVPNLIEYEHLWVVEDRLSYRDQAYRTITRSLSTIQRKAQLLSWRERTDVARLIRIHKQRTENWKVEEAA